MRIALRGGIEAVLHAMNVHPTAALVQECRGFTWRLLAKTAPLGGIQSVLHAMSAQLE